MVSKTTIKDWIEDFRSRGAKTLYIVRVGEVFKPTESPDLIDGGVLVASYDLSQR